MGVSVPAQHDGLRFDPARADRVQNWYEKVLVHTKGRFARAPFVLADFQRDDIIRPLFGTVRWDEQLQEWVRAYSIAWIEMARKSGKSEKVAGAGLYLLIADGEQEAEVYGAAKDRDQAGVVYQVAKRMVELSPVLQAMVEQKQLSVIDSKRRIVHEPTGSFYQVVASDAGGNLGTNPHGILFDEVITQPSRELWDELKTGMGTRSQPLMLAITTAGNDQSSMAFEEHLHSEAVAQDPSIDPSRFVYMRNTPHDADPWDEANWAFANPGLGDFFRIDVLRAEALEARRSIRKQNAFRQYRLNQWVRQDVRWLDLELWDQNAGLVVEEELEGRECFGGLDLASTADFAALVLLFPPNGAEPPAPRDEDEDEEEGEEEDAPELVAGDEDRFQIVCRFWLPSGALERRSSMREVIEAWAHQGLLHVTDGDVLDFRAVYADVDELASKFNLVTLGYDRWNASQLVGDLDDGGIECVGVAQTCAQLNAPSRELERLLGSHLLAHGGHPILRWMADNVTVKSDSSDNIKPDKKKSTEKIDGIVALVMSIGQWLADADAPPVFAVNLGGAGA